MANQDTNDQAPEDVPSTGPQIPAQLPKGRQSLAKSRRELTEEELGQSGVRLMLFDELDRLDGEVRRLDNFRERFYTAEKRLAVLEEKRKQKLALEILYGVCLALGVGLLMLAPTLPKGAIQNTAIAMGIVLTFCGIIAKVVQG